MSKKVLFISHLGMGDMIYMCGAVRYFTTIYNEIYVVCKDNYYNNVKMMYQDNNNIKLININPNYEFELIKELIKDYEYNGHDICLSGIHKSNKIGIQFKFISDDIHKCLYNDLELDISIMKDYFNIAFNIESINLYKKIPKFLKYIFIHSQSSNENIFIDIKKFKEDDILIINPNTNMYDINDKYYELANEFINKPIFIYTDIIINALELHMVDSSFSCMSALLNTNTSQNKYLYARGNTTYKSLFDNTWIYKKT